MKKSCDQVFGISNDILEDSYIDRGSLDNELERQLRRKNHIALRGASKSGKSWLRQRKIPNSLTVQCRFGTTVVNIFTDALSQLGIRLIIEESSKGSFKGKIESTAQGGFDLIGKLKLKLGLETSFEDNSKEKIVWHDINDLRFIADLIKESGRKLVIEDFHYLSLGERELLSFELKTLWDYGCFVVIIGVWTRSNLLISLNSDLSDRIVEYSVDWTDYELKNVLEKGAYSLKLKFSDKVRELIVSNCYKNVGLLQKLAISYLDQLKIHEEMNELFILEDVDAFESAAMSHAEQLDTLYQKFAKDVSFGIRKRKDSTGIYAHAMAAIVEADDSLLINGVSLDNIYETSSTRQPRIQKANLRTILQKLEELQVDKDGRGLVIAFNEATDEVSIIDRRLLFYRKYVTINWPWEEMIREHDKEVEENSPIVLK